MTTAKGYIFEKWISKIRIQHGLRKRGMLLPSIQRNKFPSSLTATGADDNEAGILATTDDFEFDVFISHRHEGGEDLAQAIKLQLQVCSSWFLDNSSILLWDNKPP